MKAKFVNYYRKSGGQQVFVYAVTGTPEELAAYKAAQGTNYRESSDEAKTPLFFAMRPLTANRNESVPLTITANNRVVADDSDRVFENAFKLDDYVLREQARLMAMQAMGGRGVAQLADAVASRPADQMPDNIPAAPVGEAAPVEVGENIPS